MSLASEANIIHISSERARAGQPFHDLWKSRELLLLLARRDVKLRYQQRIVGFGWALLQPFLTTLVLTVFRRLSGGMSNSGVPYPLFVGVGLAVWTFHTHSLNQASNSLLNYSGVMKKIYFPRLVLPLSAVLASAFDLFAALPLIPILMLWFGVAPGLQIIALPAILLLSIGLSTGIGIWLSVINAKFRDTANALPFLTQLWFFLSPIAYSPASIPERWQLLWGLNPMLGILTGLRWSLLGIWHPMMLPWLGFSTLLTVILVVTGMRYFLDREEILTDMF